MFGSTDEGCGILILPALQQPALKILRRGTNMGRGGSPLGYLGYGPIAYDKSSKANLTQFDALAPDQVVKFRLAHRSTASLTDGLKALWLLAALGGIGSRSRRGWGSLSLQSGLSFSNLPHLAACVDRDSYRKALHQGLEELAPLNARKVPSDLAWTALSTKARIVLSPNTFPSAAEAHEDLGRQFIAFRGYDRRGDTSGAPGPDYHNTKRLLQNLPPAPGTLPERAGFGLPYAQAYRSLKKQGAKKPPTATFTPFWPLNGKEIEGRRASPLLCKIVRLATGKFLWQVAFLPARFLPHGAKVRARAHRRYASESTLRQSLWPSWTVRSRSRSRRASPYAPQRLLKLARRCSASSQQANASGTHGVASGRTTTEARSQNRRQSQSTKGKPGAVCFGARRINGSRFSREMIAKPR